MVNTIRLVICLTTFVSYCVLRLPSAEAAQPPALFFYPQEYRYTDGHTLNSPQTVTADQITKSFPFIPQMSGVVLMVYWSALCPTAHHCDFSIIDEVLHYWGKRGKKVVLDVATIGFPSHPLVDSKEIVGATPQWVMKQITTYDYDHTPILDGTPPTNEGSAKFPDFRDKRFLALQIP